MRVMILDASVDERRRLADVIRQFFPKADLLDTTGDADGDRLPAGGQDASKADPAPGYDRDIQAAALFPLENPNPVLRIARDGTVLFANRAGERLLQAGGLSTSDPLPDRWRQLVQEILAEGRERRLQLALAGEVFELDGVPILAAGYLNVYGRNVTAQVRHAQAERRATEALRRANEELEQRVQERTAKLALANEFLARHEAAVRYQASLLEHIHEAVIANDLQHRITAWNHAAEALFGWQASEVLGRPLAEILPTSFLNTSPRDVYRQIAEQGSWHGELLITCRDGSLVDVEAIGVAVRDASGQVVGQVGVNRDITRKKRAQARLAYQANLLENVSDAIVAHDGELRITAWNHAAEELYGRPAAEAIGAYAPDVVGSRLTADERAAVLRAIAETGRWQGEVSHTRRDGTPIIVECTGMALRDDTGRIYASVTVNRDITERKRIEAELRVRREMLEDLMRRTVELQERERSYVANQLYNDEGQRLAALLLSLGRLQRDTHYSPAMTAQLAEMIALVDDVLQDMHSLAVTLRPASLDRLGLGPALQQCAFDLGGEFDVAIQTELSALDGLRLPRDIESSLYRIVQEALRNAVQHAPACCISVTAAHSGGRLKIVVEDDGAGFDVAAAQRQGGLGLLSMRERARALGGSLTVESAPGKGTTISIEAPTG